MTTLPRAVMELVLSFAVKDVSAVKVLPTKRKGWRRLSRQDQAPLATLCEWRLVCRYWRDLLGEILGQYRQRTIKLNLSHKSESEQAAALEAVVRAGPQVVELRVALFGHYSRRAGTEMTQVVDWHALLRACPNVQRLDVSKMAYVTRRDLGRLLDAASQFCLKMQALLLPLPLGWNVFAQQVPGAYRNDEDDVTLTRHLAAALERWFLRGSNGGLRQLVVPHIPPTSNEFLTAVSTFCPNVEVLDGWKLTYVSDGWGAVMCDEEWRVSIEVWEQFCRRCTRLREFNWAVVPFADAFFVPFGATQKCRLTDLALDFTSAFHLETSSTQASAAATNRQLVDNANAANLVRLEVLPGAINAASVAAAAAAASSASGFCDASRQCSSAGLCSLVRGLPFLRSLKVFLHPRCRIDLNVFDDAFLQQLAESTSYLGQFSFAEAGQYAGHQAIETVSDRGLLALAKMAHLSDVAIAALQNTSGAGLFPFIRQMSPIIKQRNVKIGVMQDFEKIIVPLLDRVAREPAGAFAGRAFALLLVNHGHLRGFSRKTCLPHQWEDRLRVVRARLEANHPTVRFQLTLERQKPRTGIAGKDNARYRISKFSVFSSEWRYPDVIGGTFYRGDIENQRDSESPFEWVLKCQ
ncbi:hypothetical protein BBJ28_00009243 [Nothophytophthora sp. Chile5]|nr:hypothetical protein BBJ28_00009243 [Nothophytophthora sp. Chile5]